MAASGMLIREERFDALALVGSLLAWAYRLVVCMTLMAVWLAVVVLLLAVLLPRGEGDTGLYTNFSLNVTLGFVTLLYYVPVLPFLLLPTREEDRFTWFLYAAYGWMMCLLGTVAYLYFNHRLFLDDIPLDLGLRPLAAAVAAIFLTPMIVALLLPVDTHRRLIGLVVLLIGWLAVEVEVFGVTNLVSWLGLGGTGAGQTLLLLASLLYVIVASSIVFPDEGELRRQMLGLFGLLWLFAVAAVVCFQMMHGRITLSLTSRGLETFYCMVASIGVAPFLSWVGMPWAAGRRLAWLACMALAAFLVATIIYHFPFPNTLNVLEHVWSEYNGTHVLEGTVLF